MVTVTELNRAPDGTFESLEATTSITDPAGNTYTGSIDTSLDIVNSENLSDLQTFSASATSTGVTETLVDINNSGLCYGGIVQGFNLSSVTLNIDGETKSLPNITSDDSGDQNKQFTTIPPIEFESSLKIEFSTNLIDNNKVAGYIHLKT